MAIKKNISGEWSTLVIIDVNEKKDFLLTAYESNEETKTRCVSSNLFVGEMYKYSHEVISKLLLDMGISFELRHIVVLTSNADKRLYELLESNRILF